MSQVSNWTKVVLANGVSRNPGGSDDDPLHIQTHNAVLDLMICLRGATPNRHLGGADEYISVGELGLAFEELLHVIADDERLDGFSFAALERARSLLGETES